MFLSSSIDGKQKRWYYIYIVKLPRRSFHELTRWIYRYMGNAQVRSPQDFLVACKFHQCASGMSSANRQK